MKIDKWEVGLFNKFVEPATRLVVKYIKLPISRLILGDDEEPWGRDQLLDDAAPQN